MSSSLHFTSTQWRQVLEFCANELAAKLGRSTEQLLERGLDALTHFH